MKKTVSLVLALMLAVIAIFSISVMAFADEDAQTPADNTTTTTTAAPAATEPTRPNERDEQATATTTTTTTKSDAAAIIDKLTTVSTTKIPDKVTEDNDEVVTGKPAVKEENIKTYFKVADLLEINIKNLEGIKNDWSNNFNSMVYV